MASARSSPHANAAAAPDVAPFAGDMPASALHAPILRWYAESARSLPWRQPSTSAWEVLVSEVMLQQTPVSRVLPVYDAWLRRWPTPAALAADSPGNALRIWGKLGYPRRVLRLHETATTITLHHSGAVPATYPELRRLTGVGDYTASAILAFGYHERATPLDTNVLRVLRRAVMGLAQPPVAPSANDRRVATQLLPDDGSTAARWSVALMELGAVVCRSRAPSCERCPVTDACAWRGSGYPPEAQMARRKQSYAGTDRQCRGALLAVVRDSAQPVAAATLSAAWQVNDQRDRALASLLDDKLIKVTRDGAFSLP